MIARSVASKTEDNMADRWKWTALIVALIAGRGWSATTPEPADRDQAEAREFERRGQWERASELYLRLLADDRRQPESRDRITACLRHLQQARRHADPAYRSYAAALPL